MAGQLSGHVACSITLSWKDIDDEIDPTPLAHMHRRNADRR